MSQVESVRRFMSGSGRHGLPGHRVPRQRFPDTGRQSSHPSVDVRIWLSLVATLVLQTMSLPAPSVVKQGISWKSPVWVWPVNQQANIHDRQDLVALEISEPKTPR